MNGGLKSQNSERTQDHEIAIHDGDLKLAAGDQGLTQQTINCAKEG